MISINLRLPNSPVVAQYPKCKTTGNKPATQTETYRISDFVDH